MGRGHAAVKLHGTYTIVWAKGSARTRVPYSTSKWDGGGIVDSPQPFRENVSLVGGYMLAGYSMACGMHDIVA